VQSFNVETVTRTGVGAYTIGFQRNMIFRQNTDRSPTAIDYAVSGSLNGIGFLVAAAKAAANVTVQTFDQTGAAKDFSDVSVVCHGGNSMI
jgi:hypothetical protein